MLKLFGLRDIVLNFRFPITVTRLKMNFLKLSGEAVVQRCSVKKVFLKSSQNSLA